MHYSINSKDGNKVKTIAIIIPAYEPNENLITLVKMILESSQTNDCPLIIVNDGSGPSYKKIFDNLSKDNNVTIINHQQNLGKGRALKTAFNFLQNHYPDVEAAVTIDSDGQHTVSDMWKCIVEFQQKGNENPIILGSRMFSGKIPFRSKFGNIFTRNFLSAASGLSISDTQTGLRVIPSIYFSELENLEGERFEYEMNMLIYAKENGLKIYEVPIETIYLEKNESSHFDPIKDSLRIYHVFLKFIISSLTSFFIDIVIFTVLMFILKDQNFNSIFLSSIVARVISAFYNYTMNQKIVFKKTKKRNIIKYFILVVLQVFISSLLITFGTNILPLVNLTILKIITDLFLFFFSYYIQKHIVFKE